MAAGLVQPVAVREGKQAMVNHEVNCEQVWREISNYLDEDVDAALRMAMEEHFRSCKRCASVLAGTRNVVRLYEDERMLEVPAGFSLRLERRLEKDAAVQGRRARNWSAWLIPVAALVLIAGGVKLVSTFTFRPPAKSILAVPAQDIPPNLQVVVSDGSKLFHVPGCKYIHDKASERTLTAKEAMQQGYAPCPRCLRQYLKTGMLREHDADEAKAEAQEEQEEAIGNSTP
jgi:hypothetical protein